MSVIYKSNLKTSPSVDSLLHKGRILGEAETPRQMIERVVQALYEQEIRFGTSVVLARKYACDLGKLMDEKSIVMSTPILTNAGRFPDRPLSACMVPPVEITNSGKEKIVREVNLIHEQGMGTGFNLDSLIDPVEMLRFLNHVAVEGARSGREDRPVGNMAVLSVYHPAVLEFIHAKEEAPTTREPWKFNISVDVDEPFFTALERGEDIVLRDGRSVPAEDVFSSLCIAARKSADPGLVFLNRMNRRNAVPMLGLYRTTAPCGEVGLADGEACQFGYINLGNFVNDAHDRIEIDTTRLIESTQLLTRFLDNALEISIAHYSAPQSVEIMSQKRKIGIGLCGVADAFSRVGFAYSSAKARTLLKNAVALINFTSKEESIKLAQERGSCGAMRRTKGNRYIEEGSHLYYLYGKQSKDIDLVKPSDWADLDDRIRSARLLRNISTTALPPTGRSALIVEASQGIEPHFSLDTISDKVRTKMLERIIKKGGGKISKEAAVELMAGGNFIDEVDEETMLEIRRYIATAKDIAAQDHLKMTVAAQAFTDESVSKTVNLPHSASVDDVRFIYQMAWEQGLSGVTMYVDGTYVEQPKKLMPAYIRAE